MSHEKSFDLFSTLHLMCKTQILADIKYDRNDSIKVWSLPWSLVNSPFLEDSQSTHLISESQRACCKYFFLP